MGLGRSAEEQRASDRANPVEGCTARSPDGPFLFDPVAARFAGASDSCWARTSRDSGPPQRPRTLKSEINAALPSFAGGLVCALSSSANAADAGRRTWESSFSRATGVDAGVVDVADLVDLIWPEREPAAAGRDAGSYLAAALLRERHAGSHLTAALLRERHAGSHLAAVTLRERDAGSHLAAVTLRERDVGSHPAAAVASREPSF